MLAEWFDPKSFAGIHDLEPNNQPMSLVVFDIWLPNNGFINPRDFIKTFDGMPIPKVVYEGNFSQEFIADVRAGRYNVGQGSRKAWSPREANGGETQAYLDKLQEVFGSNWKEYGE